jgi:hypothetical protein
MDWKDRNHQYVQMPVDCFDNFETLCSCQDLYCIHFRGQE